MSSIPITDILDIDKPSAYKLHAARYNRVDEPLSVYVRDKDEWVGWNKWRGERHDFNRRYIFSLIDFYHEANTWLFGGIFKVMEEKKGENYKIKKLSQYSNYVGRLKVKWTPPSRNRAFKLEKYLEEMIVSEILKLRYSGESFPGYENINHRFSTLEPIFKNEVAGWKAALENVKGVYVVMDDSNGKKYVGSAYGEDGVWSRWGCYIGTGGHAWNDELEKLIKKKGPDYAHNHFTLSLLEHYPMKVDDSVIIGKEGRENYWKKVFLSSSKKFGYNKN